MRTRPMSEILGGHQADSRRRQGFVLGEVVRRRSASRLPRASCWRRAAGAGGGERRVNAGTSSWLRRCQERRRSL